ncbi:MAG: hypothetical protein CVU39_13175 [Chloroflexi bacterium HGW-Chloroflexi-10]|nr:MAG: hypothetical protein CVU39_13175 [Chloroflexi bacterium HGW-Chloroflexi-10]
MKIVGYVGMNYYDTRNKPDENLTHKRINLKCLLFWLTTIFIAWILGKVVLWNILRSLFPIHITLWGEDVTKLIPLAVVGEYEYIRMAIAGILILFIVTSLISYPIDKATYIKYERIVRKDYEMVHIITTSLRLALAWYFVVFWINLETFWSILIYPDEPFYTFELLRINVFFLMIIWFVAYLVLFEGWQTIPTNWKTALPQFHPLKHLLIGRMINCVVIFLLLIWMAIPYRPISYANNIVLGIISFYFIFLSVQKKRN